MTRNSKTCSSPPSGATRSGRLKITMVSANGREIILSYAQTGEVLGEIALFDRGHRTATVSAIEPAVVLAVPAHMVEAAAIAER